MLHTGDGGGGIPNTYLVIKIIGATIKVLTQRIRAINYNLRRANCVLLRIHVRKRKFKINRGELWDD